MPWRAIIGLRMRRGDEQFGEILLRSFAPGLQSSLRKPTDWPVLPRLTWNIFSLCAFTTSKLLNWLPHEHDFEVRNVSRISSLGTR
jgi:hypothetical protein